MAAKKESATFASIMNDIKERKFAPVYVLMGEESYFIDKICDALSVSVLPEDEREFNQFTVFGADVTAAQVADLARELPMMSQYKVVIVKEAQNIKNTDELEKYFDHPSPQTVLVYCHKNGTVDKRKKFASKAEAVGVVFESKKVGERDLPGFVVNYLAQRQVTIEQNTAMVIAESIGSDLCRMVTELDKLCMAMPEGDRRVTADLVEQCIGVSKEYNPFEFRNAIINHDVVRANRIANYFDKNPKSGGVYVLLPTLFSYFQNLMVAWYAPDRRDPQVLMQHLELRNTWAVRDYQNGMRYYSAMKTMQIISKIREIDEKSKGLDSPNTTPGDLLKELLFFILH